MNLLGQNKTIKKRKKRKLKNKKKKLNNNNKKKKNHKKTPHLSKKMRKQPIGLKGV